MDQNKKQRSLRQFIKSQFLKRAVAKLLLSVSLFSLFFSHSALLSFVHYFNLYLSTLPFKLFSHTLDKNCTFLLCNGLLVFLAKYSGLFSLSSSSNKYNYNLNESFKNFEDDSQSQMTIMETLHDHHQVPLLEKEAELENTRTQQKRNAMQQENENKKSETEQTEAENSTEEKNHEEQEEKEEERAVVIEEDKAEAEAETEAEAESSFFIEEIDDDEEEEENEKLSNEELNKKFDDFIRKMKEELRIEARQQLIMV